MAKKKAAVASKESAALPADRPALEAIEAELRAWLGGCGVLLRAVARVAELAGSDRPLAAEEPTPAEWVAGWEATRACLANMSEALPLHRSAPYLDAHWLDRASHRLDPGRACPVEVGSRSHPWAAAPIVRRLVLPAESLMRHVLRSLAALDAKPPAESPDEHLRALDRACDEILELFEGPHPEISPEMRIRAIKAWTSARLAAQGVLDATAALGWPAPHRTVELLERTGGALPELALGHVEGVLTEAPAEIRETSKLIRLVKIEARGAAIRTHFEPATRSRRPRGRPRKNVARDLAIVCEWNAGDSLMTHASLASKLRGEYGGLTKRSVSGALARAEGRDEVVRRDS